MPRRLSPDVRRAAILDQARRAFAHASYDAVNVADVARAAGVSEPLVHRYFAGKGGLYLEVVRGAAAELLRAQELADAELPADASVRRRIESSVEVTLDFVARSPVGWTAPLRTPHETFPHAAEVRLAARDHYLHLLRTLLDLPADPGPDLVLRGYLAFVDAACVAWVEEGCPPGRRSHVVGACVGALEGALDAG